METCSASPGNTIGKRTGVDIHEAGLRKAIISGQRKLGESSTVSNEQLAKQMTHAVSTADQFYNVANTEKEHLHMATFIKTVTGGKDTRKVTT
jgi:hypothetical protein